MYFTFDPGLTVTVNFIFTLREPNVYKPHGFFLGFLATFICFCVTVLFYCYLYFVVNQIKLQSYKVTMSPGEKITIIDKKCNAPLSPSTSSQNFNPLPAENVNSSTNLNINIIINIPDASLSFILNRTDINNIWTVWIMLPCGLQRRLAGSTFNIPTSFFIFLWIFTGCSNSVSENPSNAIVTKARCYANCLTKVSHLSIETFSMR